MTLHHVNKRGRENILARYCELTLTHDVTHSSPVHICAAEYCLLVTKLGRLITHQPTPLLYKRGLNEYPDMTYKKPFHTCSNFTIA